MATPTGLGCHKGQKLCVPAAVTLEFQPLWTLWKYHLLWPAELACTANHQLHEHHGAFWAVQRGDTWQSLEGYSLSELDSPSHVKHVS